MKTNLNFRTSFVLTLKVLVPVIAVSMFLISLLPGADVGGSLGDPVQPNPRVKFASLEGRRPPPASLEGRKPPSAELEGRKPPSASLEGKRIPPASLEGRKPPAAQSALSSVQAAPLNLVDGLIVLALAALLLVPVRKSKLETR